MRIAERKYNYFYIINNLLNGRFYLGVHSTDNLDDGYMGSGDAIKAAIKNHGKENFELVPLKFFKTRKELMDFEREVVNERFLDYYKGICYNLKKGGEGGCEKKFTDEEIAVRRKESYNKYVIKNRDKKADWVRNWEENNVEKKKTHHKRAMIKYETTHKDRIREYRRQYYLKKKAAKLAGVYITDN